MKLLIVLCLLLSPGFSHVGHDHGSEETHNTDTTIIDLTPEQIQSLNLTFYTVKSESIATQRRLVGKVIPDPNHYSQLHPSQMGRILVDPQHPLPIPGQKVKAGEVVAMIQTFLDRIDQSQEKTALYRIEGEISTLEKQLDRQRKLKGVVAQKDVENTEIDLERAKRQREELKQKTFAPEKIVAPIDGVIADTHLVPGQVVTPQSLLLEVVNPEKLWVEALLFHPEEIQQITAAEARLPLISDQSIPLKFIGSSPKVNAEDQALHALFSAENASLLKLDMAVEVIITLNISSQSLLIPVSSLIEQQGQAYVLKKQDAHMIKTPLSLGRKIDHYVEVLSGLSPGDEIVSQGAHLLISGR